MVILTTQSATEPPWDHLFDDLIQWFSGGYFNHSALVGDGHLVEQIDPVTQSPLDKYSENGWAFSVAGLTPLHRHETLRWAEARVGQPYGIQELLIDGLYYGLHIPSLLRDNPRYVTCSAFIANAFARGGGYPITAQPIPSPLSLAFSPLLIGPRPWDAPHS
jgi:hypothetical protein